MDNRCVQEWQTIAKELGVRAEFGIDLRLPSGGKLVAPVRLLDFGAKRGMLLFSSSSQLGPFGNELVREGYGFSVLFELPPDRVEQIDWNVIKEVLRDWGWSGADNQMPSWMFP